MHDDGDKVCLGRVINLVFVGKQGHTQCNWKSCLFHMCFASFIHLRWTEATHRSQQGTAAIWLCCIFTSKKERYSEKYWQRKFPVHSAGFFPYLCTLLYVFMRNENVFFPSAVYHQMALMGDLISTLKRHWANGKSVIRTKTVSFHLSSTVFFPPKHLSQIHGVECLEVGGVLLSFLPVVQQSWRSPLSVQRESVKK